MRFIKKEEIITTLCNKEIRQPENIISVLKEVKNEQFYFSLVIKTTDSYGNSGKNISYDKVRIKNINEQDSTVDFIVFKKSASLVVNSIQLNNIVEIYAVTQKQMLSLNNEKNDKTAFLDLED